MRVPDDSSPECSRCILQDIVSDERPIGVESQIESAGRHVRENLPGPAQDVRFVLRLERLFHLVEQRRRRHGEQSFVAPVLQRLPRPVFRGAGLFQLAVRPGVVQLG